jgi:WD40 repeat protein
MKSSVLMTGGKDKAIKIWDIRSGKPSSRSSPCA